MFVLLCCVYVLHQASTILCLHAAQGDESRCKLAFGGCQPSCRDVDMCHADVAYSTAWDDKLGGATGYGAALLAQWAILEGEGQP